MQVRLKKGRDGPDALTCTRDDGTSTWRRIQRGLAFHDLAHYAVETELAIPDGFFGLVASGWSFEALVAAEERSHIPPGAMWVELLVNQFLTEAACGEAYDDDAFRDGIRRAAEKLHLVPPRVLDSAEIARVRGRIIALVAQWKALEMGDTLELEFATAASR